MRRLLVVILAFCVGGVHAQTASETRADMQAIFSDMRFLLPLSVSAAWQDSRNAVEVREALESVSRRASALGDHAESDQRGFRYLGNALASDLREVLQRYERSEFDSASYLLLRATDYCITCHLRLPAPGDSPLSTQFIDEPGLQALPLEQRAQLQLATRRFEDAMSSFETLLAMPDIHPALLLDALTDYLVVSIRVTPNIDRAIGTLTDFRARPDLWLELERDVQSWLDALRAVRPEMEAEPTLELAHGYMTQARKRTRYFADRRGLVYFLLAASVAHRVVATNPADSDLAHAYYLLGLVEFRTGGDFWVAQGEMFLETAIRLAPGTPVAVDAYAALEEEVLLSYTGSAGLNLPDEERLRLARLRGLATMPR